MVERVAIRPWAAETLEREYRMAASELAGMAQDLRVAMADAAELLGDPMSAVPSTLEGVAIELAGDGDDLSWRLDLIMGHDGSADSSGRRVADLPEHRPALPAHTPAELAAELAGLIDSGVVMNPGDRAALANGLAAYVDSTYFERWGRVVDFWEGDLRNSDDDDDRALSERLIDIADELERNSPSLARLEGVLGELAAQQHDPGYMAAFFRSLGPEGTRAVPLLLADAAYSEALQSSRDLTYTAEPIAVRDGFASSLAVASNATSTDRYGATHHVLGGGWFDDLFEGGVWVEGKWFSDDETHLHDTFPALFAAGEFRHDVAVRTGMLGFDVFDHEVTVDRGIGSPLFSGFAEFETNWEDRGGMLLGAATRVPEAAAAVLIAESTSGRTGAQIVADRDYDNMDRSVVAPHYADLIFAGTVLAEDRALANGIDTTKLHDPWHAKAALIETVAEQVRQDTTEDPYSEAVNLALSKMVVQTMPHFVHVLPHGDTPVSVDLGSDATSIPSLEAGIYVRPEYMNNLFGGLFRVESDRLAISAALEQSQREAYASTPDLPTIQRVGLTEGALISGYNIAGIDDAHQQASEQQAVNDLIDSTWNGADFVLGLTPKGQVVQEGIGTADDVLDIVGVNPIEDYIHRDTTTVVEIAETEARSAVFGTTAAARRFVFGRAFDQMQAEYRIEGIEGLSVTSEAIFDQMIGEEVLSAVFEPGISDIADFSAAGGEITNEWVQASAYLIETQAELREAMKDYLFGLNQAWPELSVN